MSKLFKVTKTESGYRWHEVSWVRYFVAATREVVEAIVRKRYGRLDHYYRYEEAESHITIEEVEYEDLTVPSETRHDD